ncbi:mitochondrial ribosomal protein subunit L58 [Schizosaccharomyces pombe]|uniref:Large ribosomal subunit protein mL58 n=1 Tax=Schizosaccharomyces pombe (strain 972 / ATCC 24843) TaxID=284812 RepID=RM20_SCHPO|nr:putative mitochondrial ribosomal protein subunit L20 [Schizosaccharomyces pombe]O94723.1 RecName: Full=Large ribosomal subunit protein mL58; AltName: Full=54S ribosomal protein L20, mitochondrial; Flags: Precursor [Schizosaccharomyces pombe 972h-]CAB38166.1 mitochondrial ribosomal protein subunit L20 (predicted) [Schizosaccharomyces pombe]|eukprot:NP_587969.1 putative mitochondrial ribosomal protein subunit L20 [Schizosaccharomyces pombe]
MLFTIKPSFLKPVGFIQTRNLNRLYPKQRIPKRPKIPMGSKIAEVTETTSAYYNPPASSPDVRITPPVFRYDAPPIHQRDTSLSKESMFLPPAVSRKSKSKGKLRFSTHQLSSEDIKSIQDLRTKDPNAWTTGTLSKKFNTTRLLISRVCEAPKERIQKVEENFEAEKLAWGSKKREIRRQRASRQAFRTLERVAQV